MAKTKNPDLTALMKYRLSKAPKGYRITKKWVNLSEISPYLIKAVLIAEDDRFYMHEGFDVEGIKEALKKDIKKRKVCCWWQHHFPATGKKSIPYT